MRKIFLPFLITFLLSVSGLSQTSTQGFTTDQGAQFQVSLKPDKGKLMLGETTFLSFEITNHSETEFYTTLGLRDDLNGRPADFYVEILDENGKSVTLLPSGGMHGFGGALKIPAKGSAVTKLFLPDWAKFGKTGNYTITVKKSVDILDQTTGQSARFETELFAWIKIIPTDQAKLGELIDSLGEKLVDSANLSDSETNLLFLAEADPEARLFAFIEDPRVIKYHIQILEKFGQKEFEVGRQSFLSRLSAWALKKYNDDSALEALQKTMTSPNEFVRAEVAKSLRDSPHPKAFELLLKMSGDKDSFIRLIVVDGLRKIETGGSTRLLRKMLNDEDQWVRKEVREILDKRSQK
jgi:hypothetical protein